MDYEMLLCVLLMVCFNSYISECFRWTRNQQSSHVINSKIGSDVTLSCDFILSSEEESAMQQFHLIYWTREIPTGSQNWEGIATRTNLVRNSLPQVIYHDKSRLFMTSNNSLKILNVGPEDDTQYQCEVKSSFYTSPSLVKMNVLYKPKNTRISYGRTQEDDAIQISCTAQSNPTASYSFSHNDKLVQKSASQNYTIVNGNEEHSGVYACVPWNVHGEGPKASVSIGVKGLRIESKKSAISNGASAGISVGVTLLVVGAVILAVIVFKVRATSKTATEPQTNLAYIQSPRNNVAEAYVGPGYYGSVQDVNRAENENCTPPGAAANVKPMSDTSF